MAKDIDSIVRDEAFHWGNNAHVGYFEKVELTMDAQWEKIIFPFISVPELRFDTALDLAAGRGRNSNKLKDYFRKIIIVDVNQENIDYCRQRFAGDDRFVFLKNSGYSLAGVEDNSVSFVYCFDAMVHFDIEIIIPYLKEFHRVLEPGGIGFCHHSNYSAAPGKDFKENPHWRNYMTKDLFAHLCIHNGLNVLKQMVSSWGGVPGLDCHTLFRK